MAIAKLRELSKFGVVTDVSSFNLPPQAWTYAKNCRFKSGSIERGPVLRRIPVTLSNTEPRYIQANTPTSGFDTIYIGYLDGTIYELASQVETDVSISGYTPADSDTNWTGCQLGGVNYINRPDRVPWFKTTAASDFATLTNWTGTWRANILRSCNSVLCAFGITKGSNVYPTMIKTSSIGYTGTVPASWDETDPTQNAYENTLSDMQGGITEAQTLGNNMIVYGYNEAWMMQPVTSTDIWQVHRIFNDAGCINANCAVEVEGKHFVFGPTDIYMHDGSSKKSISDSVVRRHIFDNLDASKTNRCFVVYDRARREVRFNYVSGDEYLDFATGDGCNRCAVYYVPEGTWTFDDLPYIYSGTVANIDQTETWATIQPTWDESGSTWLDLDSGLRKSVLLLGEVDVAAGVSASVYAVDNQYTGSIIPYAVDDNATRPALLERGGIDLDELPNVKKLEGYKTLSSIWPQGVFEPDSTLEFAVGGADNYNDEPDLGDAQEYDGSTYKRCDFNTAGRYVRIRITQPSHLWFKLTALDLDLYATGEH
jgi:hypothetical protein